MSTKTKDMKKIILTITSAILLASCSPEPDPCFSCEVAEVNGELKVNCIQIECTN